MALTWQVSLQIKQNEHHVSYNLSIVFCSHILALSQISRICEQNFLQFKSG